MNKVKKILMMVLSLVLVAAMSIGGTVAYLQDDDSDVNVMTLGNVKIEQHEYEREVDANGDYVIDPTYGYVLKDFTQGKPLLPATELDANSNPYNFGAGDYSPTRVKMSQVGSHGSMDVFVNENAQDKFVTVENTGKTAAYVRTIIAMEIGSLTEARFEEVISTSSFMTAQGVWDVTDIGTVVIDGNKYFVSEYLYKGAADLGGVHANGVLPADDTTYPSLAQVYMKATATNEDVVALDGNNNGTYDILVVSQAVQADGFDDAETALNAGFGDITTTNHPWADGVKVPVMVSTADELRTAIVNGDDIVLTADITVDEWNMYSETQSIGSGKIITVKMDGLTIDGNGHSLTVDSVESAGNGGHLFDDASNLNIRNLTITMNCDGGAIDLESGVIENVVFNYQGICITAGNGDITVKNCMFNTAKQTIYYEDARDNLKIINNTFNVDNAGNVVILRGEETFTGNTVNSGRTVNIVSANATVTGNTFNTRVKLYQDGQTLSGNIFGADAYIDIEDGISVDVSGNYWGGGAPSSTQIPTEIKDNVVVKNYYTTNTDGVLSNLVTKN